MSRYKLSGYNPIVTALIAAMALSCFTIGCSKPNANNTNPKGKAGSDNIVVLSSSNSNSGNIVEIREKMFATQISDVYMNPDDYLGKTIKLEGIFMGGQPYPDMDPYYSIFRYAPGGCCGNDGMAGFEVKGETCPIEIYPAGNSWVEATGVLKEIDSGSYKSLYIDLSSLTILSKRGAEYVVQ